MSDETKAVAMTAENQPSAPLKLLELAVSQGADVEKLERLMALQERWEANQAKTAFFAAMTAVQSEMPRVVRDAENQQTRSMYARLETISRRIAPHYTRHGFSLSFSTEDSPLEQHIRTVCDCMHSGGHSRRYHVDLPPDNTGIQGKANKTMVHATGSTLSYARRYLTLLIFNVAVGGEDDDGNAAGGFVVDAITPDQAISLQSLMEEVGAARDKFLAYYGIASLSDLPASRYDHAVRALEMKRSTS